MEKTFDKIGQDISNENQRPPFLILNKKPVNIIFTTIESARKHSKERDQYYICITLATKKTTYENINIPSVLKLGTQDQARKLLFIEERRK
jgi:hypothetical protein